MKIWAGYKLRSVGRPSRYKPRYCKRIIDFFDREPTEYLEIEHFDKKGKVAWVDKKVIPCQCPTFERFSFEINVSRHTLHDWCKKYPEFLAAYEKARSLQANIMLVNGMSGLFNPGFTGLSMKNMHGWSDKQEIENTHTINQMPAVTLNDKELDFDVGEPLQIEEKPNG